MTDIITTCSDCTDVACLIEGCRGIPPFLDARLPVNAEARAQARANTPVRPMPRFDDARVSNLTDHDREVIAELTAHERHRQALREAIREPAKQAFFERVAAERAAVREVKAAAEETAKQSRRQFRRVKKVERT